jgi:hypothetical protein
VGPGNFDRQVESPWLACDPQGGFVYLVYTEISSIFNPSIGGYEITFARSTDGGVTFEPRQVLSSEYSGDARAVVGADGEVHVLWHDYSTGQVLARRSDNHGLTFGAPSTVAPMQDNVALPPPGWSSSFIRRNPYYYMLTSHSVPNAPAVVADRSGGPHDGTLYAAWSEYAEGTVSPTSPVNEVEPNDTYATAMPITFGQEVGGVSIDPGKLEPGDHDRFYFDGTAGTTVHLEGVLDAYEPEPPFLLTRSVFIYCGDDTTRLQFVGTVSRVRPGDGPSAPVVFTLPRTGRYWLVTSGASVYSYAYRIRLRELTPSPTSAAQDHRDIVLVRSTDGGATWSEKIRVNDCAPGDDDSFPEVVVDDLGQVHVAWYCKRDEVDGCGTLTNTYWTVSSDGGQTFRPAQRVSSTPSPWECSGGGPNIGDHLGLSAGGGRVHIAWTEVGCPDSLDIYTARIEDIATGVAIGRFEVAWTDSRVRLGWQVNDGRGIAGFRLHRAIGEDAFEPLGEAIAYRGEGAYEQFDEATAAGVAYRYRLEALHDDGTSRWEGPIAVMVPARLQKLSWAGAVPNPFRESVALELAVPQRGPVRVRVYDVQGHEVARLHEGELDTGVHRITWAGTTRGGRPVPPGVYLVRADGHGEVGVRRVLRLR